MTDELRRALNAAYQVFARYTVPGYLGLSGNVQLRDLTIENWHQLNAAHDMGALMYSDDGSMLRYFLPRWLDWLGQDPARRDDLGYWEFLDLGYRLAQAKWREWPADEVRGVARHFGGVGARRNQREQRARPLLRGNGSVSKRASRWDWRTFPCPANCSSFYPKSVRWRFIWNCGSTPICPKLRVGCGQKIGKNAKVERAWVITSRLESELETAFFADAGRPQRRAVFALD